ncbi:MULTISPECIES: LysR substrate-binding domain-containing protein [unclassified Paludibacterium]|uniref:LysR substrate-binding domain-containing protein n=1 Tax=unclassified Paludibacterium TaxID=2618429 RepID=UPI001C03FD45|nr:LysR substrate-binding domain-containing protein [Paludibacterium sp. B53371]BEV72645.1 LysR family transcriptional regulator [Paludibacterium sp. THUN1379]
MDLRVLKYFEEVVQSGSFARAAERVHITQPALSKAIHQLEDELGVVLLERGKRGVGLKVTAAGELVLEHARQLLAGRARLLADLQDMTALQRGELRLGLPPLGSGEIFAPILARFREQYPAIQLSLLERGGEELAAAVRDEQIELAATILPLREDMAMLFVHDDPIRVALPRSHPLAGQSEIALGALAETPLVMFEHGFVLNRLIREACQSVGFTPREVARIGQPGFGLALVAAGAGAMLLPDIVAQRHAVEGVVLRPLTGSDLRWRLALVWRQGASLSFAARAFIALTRQAHPLG